MIDYNITIVKPQKISMIAKIFISQNTMDEIANIISWSMDSNSAMQSIQDASGGMLSGFSFQTLMAGVIMGIIGVYFFKIWKKEGKTISLICGVGLCIVPYFIQKIGYLIWAWILLTAIPIITKH